MPAQRAAATFEPISPDLDLAALVEQTPNFQYVDRIPCDMIETQGIEAFEKLVLHYVILGGKPLVIEGYNNRLNQWTFSTQWLKDNVGKNFEQARALEKGENLPLSINHYLDSLPMLANQWNKYNYKEKNRQRLYLKDIDCPQLWHEKLKEVIPPELFYLNDSTGEKGGPGALDERVPHGIGTRKGRGIARSGDLMSSLPTQMRADNLMCYVGHEGTYTPAHREMCASLGQNIMVEASGTMSDDGKPTKPGSSIWFMTETKDRHVVAEYWLSSLGHDIEVESHFAQINAWKKAPFTVYILEQKVGDFLLIPPLAPHQVWNRGTRTMKVAWNRTTVETLELALSEALPRARMVCRDEQYKNKSIILFTLNRYATLLTTIRYQKEATRDEKVLHELRTGMKIKQLAKDFKRLFQQFHTVLLSEIFAPNMPEKKIEYVPYDSFVTCSYCRCNIFNRFLTCKTCLVKLEDGSEDTYDICMDCYAMGRSCRCLSKHTWVEQFPWKDLLEKHEIWREQIISIDGKITTKTPLPLDQAQERLTKKTLARICQEQLRSRPFKDPAKKVEPEEPDESESDDVNADGTLKKKPKKRRSEKWLKDHLPCHICMKREDRWKLAVCDDCSVAYCYGSLWRAFDTMPQTVMEDLHWRCPKCRKICNCTKCATNPSFSPYQPNGTILGHDTRKFADPRSVESLVDFSFSNMHWLKKAGDDHPTESRRLERRRSEAAIAKSTQDIEEDEDVDEDIDDPLDEGDQAIDPRLGGGRGERGNGSVMRQAAMALSAMDGLSQLEQDPAAFMAQAGITSGDFASNGDYEYPDPDAAQQLIASAQHNGDNGEIIKKGKVKKKKKKTNHMDKVQNEAAGFTDDANRKFFLQQSQKTFTEAKKSGKLIIAKAAMTGDRLIAKLKIDPYRLAALRLDNETTQRTGDALDEAPVQVQSDLPNLGNNNSTAQKSPQVHKKRPRGEVDEDFVTKKRITENQPEEENISEDSSVPDEGAQDEDSGDEFVTGGRRPAQGKRRSLPAYLARRSPVEGGELPKELSGRRTSRLKPSKPKPVNRPQAKAKPVQRAPVASMSSAPPAHVAPVVPLTSSMASIMGPKGQESNGSEDGDFEEDISMPDAFATEEPSVAKAPSPTVAPVVSKAPATSAFATVNKTQASISPEEDEVPPQAPTQPQPVVSIRPGKPPAAEEISSDESSEYEAPPKPKTPTPSESEAASSSASASPPTLQNSLPVAVRTPAPPPKSKPLDKAALNRLAKQRAAAGDVVSDFDSDVDDYSSDDSLVAKSAKKSNADDIPARGAPVRRDTSGSARGSESGRGRGRPRKFDILANDEVHTPVPAPKKSILSRGRGRAKVVSARKSM